MKRIYMVGLYRRFDLQREIYTMKWEFHAGKTTAPMSGVYFYVTFRDYELVMDEVLT